MSHLSPRVAFAVLASIVVSFLAGSAAPTPLYGLYQARWGFSPITTTVIFGVYAVAVLVSLLVLGSLSDFVGRRPVVLGAIALQAVAMVLFATAGGVGQLLVARVVQGVSAGAAVAAIGAGMIDLDRARGTIANAVAPMTGTATGGLLAGLCVRFLPAPTHTVYALLFGMLLVQGALVLRMRETVTPRPGALGSLRPVLRVPVELRRVTLLAVPLLVAAWSLAGFYGSLAPALVRTLVPGGSPLLGGAALFVLAGSGAVAVLVLRARAASFLTGVGTTALMIGVAITLVGVVGANVVAFFVGTAVAGVGFGTGFQGAVREVVPLAAPEVRAGVLSVLFVTSYLAMGGPAILAGVGVVHAGLVPTAHVFGAFVFALAAAARAGRWRAREPSIRRIESAVG